MLTDQIIHEVLDIFLVMVIVLDLYLVVTLKMRTLISVYAFQSVILAFFPLLLAEHVLEPHAIGISVAILALRAGFMPWVLTWSIRHSAAKREPIPLIGYNGLLTSAALLVALSFILGSRLTLPQNIVSPSTLLVPAAFTTILLGLLLLITRTHALTQVIAYLLIENGIFIFGLSLVRETPVIVEMGILLDVFVGVFIMGIVIYDISRSSEHLDANELQSLRD